MAQICSINEAESCSTGLGGWRKFGILNVELLTNAARGKRFMAKEDYRNLSTFLNWLTRCFPPTISKFSINWKFHIVLSNCQESTTNIALSTSLVYGRTYHRTVYYTLMLGGEISLSRVFFVYSSYKLVLLRNNTISVLSGANVEQYVTFPRRGGNFSVCFFPHGPVIINRLSLSFYSSTFVGAGPPLCLEPRNGLVCRWTFPTPDSLHIALDAFI